VRSLGWTLFQVDGTTDAALPLVEKARDLAKRLDDKGALAEAHGILQAFYLARSDLRNASEQGRLVAPLLEHATDPIVRTRARQFDLATGLLRGNLERTLRGLGEMGIFSSREETAITEQDRTPFVAMSHGAFALWLTGKPDEAVALARRGYQAAEALDDPWERAGLLSDWATVHAWRREPAKVEELAKRSRALAEEGAFGFWNNRADVLQRWAEVELTENMTEARAEELLTKPWVASYSRTLPPLLLSEMCMRLGRAEQALRVVSDALDLLEQSDERWLEAELHRVRGELLRAKDVAEAERSFTKAIEIARKQGALSLELRATISLHSLVAAAKKKRARDEVSRLLSLIKGGEETPDIAEARKVLGR
jgi:tetratricopeptide (TPR) repeat protein